MLAYSGDSGPCGELVELARDADLFLCEATLERGELEGDDRGHLDPDEAVAAASERVRDGSCSRTGPQELPLPAGIELAHDGLELDF